MAFPVDLLKGPFHPRPKWARDVLRAEVIQVSDFLDVGGFVEARKRGILRQEGKTYRIQNQDIVTFLFNVS